LLLFSVLIFCYSLVNCLLIDPLVLFNFSWKAGFITASILLPISIAKFIIAHKVRTRLIIEILEESKYYSFIVYNQVKVKVDKLQTPLPKKEADYFLNDLISSSTGTIFLPNSRRERFIIIVENKRYYLIPALFENNVPMLPT
jgi:hypothetical protein